jgi:hypothetical protein
VLASDAYIGCEEKTENDIDAERRKGGGKEERKEGNLISSKIVLPKAPTTKSAPRLHI